MRRTYHYDELLGRMVEGPAPRKGDGSGDGWRFSDRIYSATPFKGADGTVIDTRRKHREYMKRHDLTTSDDYQGSWQKAAEKREEFYTKGTDREERREQVARALEEKRRG